jgi:hypothetical protein
MAVTATLTEFPFLVEAVLNQNCKVFTNESKNPVAFAV